MSSGADALWGIRSHLSLPSCPQTAAPAGLRPRLSVLWGRPKAGRNAAAAGGSGPFTTGLCTTEPRRANSLGFCSPTPAGCPHVRAHLQAWTPTGCASQRHPGFASGASPFNTRSRGLRTTSRWLVSSGHRMPCGVGRLAPGVEGRQDREITNGIRGGPPQPRVQDSGRCPSGHLGDRC